MSFENSFIYKDHRSNFIITEWNSKQFRLDIVPKCGFPLNGDDALPPEILIAWTKMALVKKFNFDRLSNSALCQIFENSKIFIENKWFVELSSEDPIILMDGEYFAKYWWQFVDDQGTILLSEDKKWLVEFTHETFSTIYSNFEILAQNELS